MTAGLMHETGGTGAQYCAPVVQWVQREVTDADANAGLTVAP